MSLAKVLNQAQPSKKLNGTAILLSYCHLLSLFTYELYFSKNLIKIGTKQSNVPI